MDNMNIESANWKMAHDPATGYRVVNLRTNKATAFFGPTSTRAVSNMAAMWSSRKFDTVCENLAITQDWDQRHGPDKRAGKRA